MVRRIGSAGFLLVLLMVLAGGAIGAPLHAEGAEALSYRELGITHGAHLRPTLGYGDEVLDFDALVGKDIGVVMYFAEWNHMPGDHALDAYLPNIIQGQITDPSRRPAIMLTWEPTRAATGLFPQYDTAFGCTQSYPGLVIPPQDIIDGNCDVYLNIFRDDLKARPERILLRFAHEMNITDSPWWPRHFGLTEDASLYVAMYQHVYDVIMYEPGAPTNVEWVWSPNWASNPPVAWNAIPNYYPGDAYVDWIGLSGYNWYNSPPPPDELWRDFDYLYDGVLTDLTCRYAKPQIIAEVGSVEGNGTTLSKADWIAELYQRAPEYPFVRSVVWFNDFAGANPGLADFRVTTGTAASGSVSQLPAATGTWTNAYSTAIADPVYTTTLPSLSAATPPHPICMELFLPIITR
ncbi:MAG: glycosyl hydrolase [Anaerolineales bacterium]